MNSIEKIDNTLLTSKYKVIYPYDSVTNDDFMALGLLMTNIGLIILVTVTLTGSTLITYVIFKAIINTKMHDYAIFRTIGANKSLIKSFIYIENLYIVLVSYIIFLIVSLSIPLESVQRTVFYAIKVYNVWNYIVFFFLLIIMSLLISRRYCNKIFENTVQTTLKSDMG
jgi:ABC-type antimicrobial peptide transport system permease subunit